MKNTPSPNPHSGGDDQPITIRINLLVHELPKPSGSGRPANPRVDNTHTGRASSPSAPISGNSVDIPILPPLSRRARFRSEEMLPKNLPSSPPTLEGTLDRNRLNDLLRENPGASLAPSKANAGTEPDIEITLVLYV